MRNSSTLEFRNRASSSVALIGSFLLLAASFALLVLGPSMLARFQASADTMPASGYLNIAAASGIALGGGAAMIAVVSRLVRDIELRPYAGLSPVLAVFAGFSLWGLRSQLPLSGVSSEYLGVFALALSVAGGALIGQAGRATRAVGWLIAFFAPFVLLLMLWSASGKEQLGTAWASFGQPVRMYLYLLTGSALTLAILGEVARTLNLKRRSRSPEQTIHLPDEDELGPAEGPISLKMPAKRSAKASVKSVPSPDAERIFPTPQYGTANMWRASGSAEAPGSHDAYVLQSQQFEPVVKSYTPRVSVWDFDDEPVTIPKKRYWWKALLLLIVIVGGGGAAWYYGVMLPNQQKERAAIEVLNQRKAQIQAAEEREAQAKREAEAKAAAERLERYLKAPEAAAPAEPSMEGAAAIPPAPTPAQGAPAQKKK